jgi:hypothetical protein
MKGCVQHLKLQKPFLGDELHQKPFRRLTPHIVTDDKIHKSEECRLLQCGDVQILLQPSADAGSPLAGFPTLEMEAIRSSETSVNTGYTQRHTQEDDIVTAVKASDLTYIYQISET